MCGLCSTVLSSVLRPLTLIRLIILSARASHQQKCACLCVWPRPMFHVDCARFVTSGPEMCDVHNNNGDSNAAYGTIFENNGAITLLCKGMGGFDLSCFWTRCAAISHAFRLTPESVVCVGVLCGRKIGKSRTH